MTDATRILHAIGSGDRCAAEELLPLVYDELRLLAASRLASEAPGQTLQATALVHEAWMRLTKGDETVSFENRGHFFAAAARPCEPAVIRRSGDTAWPAPWKPARAERRLDGTGTRLPLQGLTNRKKPLPAAGWTT